MGTSGISPGSLLLILLIGILFFGSRRLSSLGHDLGEAIRGFKKGLHGDETEQKTSEPHDR